MFSFCNNLWNKLQQAQLPIFPHSCFVHENAALNCCLLQELTQFFCSHSPILHHVCVSVGGTQAPNLQQAQVPIIHQKICSHQDVYSHMMTDGMICAGYLHGQVDACQVGLDFKNVSLFQESLLKYLDQLRTHSIAVKLITRNPLDPLTYRSRLG